MDRHTRRKHKIHHYLSKTPKAPKWIIVALLLISVFNLGWLGLRTMVAYRLKQKYVAVMGIVVDVAHQKDKDTEQEFPVVEFQTHEGKTVIFKDKEGSTEPKYQPGQLVPVLYHKDKPYVALVDSNTQK